MRIVAWNCNMALHRKWDALLALQPDIAVISEVATPDILYARTKDALPPMAMQWCGNNPHKGLGVLAFHGYHLTRSLDHQPQFRHILPVGVYGKHAPMRRFNLLGVWA
ncbi:MAG: endonuclease/exonuclease/phosphatase family protein, partial [Pseudomonadota bacterium]